MKEKMISFLSSIGINDYESFDIDFEVVSRNRFDKQLIDMIIVKDTPWNYELLRRFQEALNNITNYRYTLRFSYIFKPSAEDVINLFEDWYRSIYHISHNLNLSKAGDEAVDVIFTSEGLNEQYEARFDEWEAVRAKH